MKKEWINSLVLILGLILIFTFVHAISLVSFVNNTPATNAFTSNTTIQINTSISDGSLSNLVYNWNGTNYTIYENSSLVLMMNFDNLTSLGENATKAVDVSKYSNNGTITGAIWNSSGKYGSALTFNSANNKVVSLNTVNLTSAGTMSAWIYAYTFPGNNPRILGTVGNIPVQLLSDNSVTAANNLSVNVYQGGSNKVIDSSYSLTAGKWIYVAMSFNSSGLNIYVNATKVYSDALATTGGSFTPQIGWDSANNIDYWNGLIDEVKIWNRSLSDTEIYEQYISNLNKLNQTQWYFYTNQSQNITTRLSDGTYTYQMFATNSSGSLNNTNLRTLTIDTINPGINFTSPTPANATSTINTSIQINASIMEPNLGSLVYNWNGTNYTIYNNSLVLMMNFDNITSIGENNTRAVDLSQYGNNGTISGATWNSSGKYGSSLVFDGTNMVDLGIPSSTQISDNITLSVWVKTSTSSWPRDIIANQWHFQDSGIMLGLTGASTIHVPFSNGSLYTYYDTTYSVADGNWHHIVVTFSSGNLSTYADGILRNSQLSATITKIGYTGSYNLLIGRDSGAVGEYWDGSIDEVRIWNRTLSANEVYQQYTSNLNKFNQTQWYLYVNQSKNAASGLTPGDYTYQTFTTDLASNVNQTEQRTLTIQSSKINIDWIYPTTNLNAVQNQFFNISVNISCSVSNCGQINVTLDPSNPTYNFATCGAFGLIGPNQTQCDTNYSSSSLAGGVSVVNGIQYWTVPATGNYNILIAGASGGNGKRSYGGKGRIINATIYLTKDQVLKILVGQKGGFANYSTTMFVGGGGGGTFVALNGTNMPIIVAGGGGGAGDGNNGGSWNYFANGSDANTYNNQSGINGIATGASGSTGGTGGTNGNGGGGDGNAWGGGSGGGFYGNGTSRSSGGKGGFAFISNGTGGANQLDGASIVNSTGGFGGGAGLNLNTGFETGGGGGGGYSGGGGGAERIGAGGGGGNYYNSTLATNVADGGLNNGDGYFILVFPGKGGTVSMNASATPFYTNVTNPYNITLNQGESRIITWTVNATGIINTPYLFFVYANVTTNQAIGNQTSGLNITILDTSSPLLNITYPLNTTYVSSVIALNYTYQDFNGGGSCWYSNSSGVWNSTAVTAGTNFTNLGSIDGNNIWTLYCNDSSGNINSTTVVFQQRVPRVNLDWIYPTTNINVSQNQFFNISVNLSCFNTNCGEINLTLDPSAGTTYNFTTCNATGSNGPNQTQCNTNYTGTNLASSVTLWNGTQNWTVPATGTYTIEAGGAQGATTGSYIGGYGAKMVGTFSLTQGQIIQIRVGQRGSTTTYSGGGGGTFVVLANNDPLIIAGGGGGGNSGGNYVGRNATTNSTSGVASNGGTAANNGLGGAGGSGSSGGGGFYSNGQQSSTSGNRPGLSFSNLSLGGASSAGGAGGFGGGSGGDGTTCGMGGAGGGFSGGSCGSCAQSTCGGGGSLNNGTSQNNTIRTTSGDGYVIFTYTSGKGGTVSMNASATPFYTNVTNPYNITLNQGESRVITWAVNATGIINNPYEFFVYANVTANQTIGNQTSKLNITLLDVDFPVINITYPLNTTYNVNINAINYTYSDSNPGSCWYSNSSGVWNSTTVTAGTNFTGVSSISNSNNWRVYCNDSSGNINSAFVIFEKRIPSISLSLVSPTGNINVSQNRTFTVSVSVSCSNGNCGQINVTLDPSTGTNYTFTNCNASGLSGPNQTQCNTNYTNTTLQGLVTVGAGIQNWTVPSTGSYTIEVAGAKGGGTLGGNGSKMIGTFQLTQGTVLFILVGQLGGIGASNNGGGGGGGTFVANGSSFTTASPLIVAGGGGGTAEAGIIGLAAVTTINGTDGAGSTNNKGINGNGGGAGTSSYKGSGGGGFYGNGTTGYYANGGGKAFISGGTGGTQGTNGGPGGFGGGGANGWWGGGAGGGYSGGGGGATDSYGGGGGGSYNIGTNQNNTNGTNSGNGYVIITAANVGKGGTVSMNTSATPFYTLTTNPYNLTLNQGESQTISWTVNATGTMWSNYTFFAYANMTSDFTIGNQTSTWNVTISNVSSISSSTSNCLNLSDNSTYQGNISLGNGFYNVTGNITLCTSTYTTTQDMLRVQANNIIIDCNGASLQGDGGAGDIGIEINNKQNVTIQNCIISNFYDGISFTSSNRGKSINNTLFNQTEYGLYVLSSNNVTSVNNNLTANLIGYYLDTSVSTNFSNNRILQSKQYGMTVKGKSSGNWIYNNYLNNVIDIRLDASDSNNWNISKTLSTNIIGGNWTSGNYWTNPTNTDFSDTCADSNGDGICDLGYTIKNKNTDYGALSKRDNSPPNVSIFTAGNNSFVNGNLTIQASASDDFAVTNVLFQYKNSTLSYTNLCNITSVDSGTNSIYSCLWQTKGFSNASEGYDFKATAFDAAGNNATNTIHYIIDRSIPYSKDLSVVYPSGQYYIRNGQNILLGVNASDASDEGVSSGINLSLVDLTLINATGNTTMLFASGSKSTAQWSWWNISSSVNSTTGQKSIPLYIRDNTVPINNQRSSDRLLVQVDNNLPTYDSISNNGPVYNGQEITFLANIYDNYLLGGYIFSSNKTGSWVNDTEIPLSGTASSIAVTKTVTTGNYSYQFFIRDNAGNINSTPISNFQVLGALPVFSVNLLSPADSLVTSSNNIDFKFIYTNGTATNCTLILDGVENLTTNSPAVNTNITLSQTLEEGTHSWNIECFDNDVNRQVFASTRTLIVDTQSPLISIIYPANTTYNYLVNAINYTYTESNIYGCWYSTNLGVTNSSLRECNNFTGLSSSEGSNTWKIYIKDLANNINSNTITFAVDTKAPNATLVSPINATSSVNTSYNFTVNLSDTNSGIKNATLNIYNSTNALINQTTITYASDILQSTLGIIVTLVDGVYKWFYSIFDFAGNSFTTQNNTLTIDTGYPRFSNYQDNNGTIINTGIGSFNVTLSNTNGTVWLSINNLNITATNLTANVYNATYNFTSNGSYSYRWNSYGNGAIHNYNFSNTLYYFVNPPSLDPQISLQLVYPTENISVNQSELFNFTVNVSCSVANCGQINVTLDPSGTVYNFTTCNNNGISGPTQTQCNSTYNGTTLANSVNVTSGIQTWVVPVTGSYTIEVAGAQGGRGGSSYAGNNPGGLGARMKGTFQLTQGTVLQILVGQNGTNDYTYAAYGGGGGGGTFVANGTNYSVATPLIVAGGGGGGGSVGTNDSNAPITTYALNGSNYNNGYGGTNGGAAWGGSYGGGAGGFYNSSTGGQGSSRGYGFRQGGSGTTGAAGGSGGFGGGGGGYGGGGGGGGYSGGGGGGWSYAGWGGGGGSYNLGTYQNNTAGINSGPGFAIITLVGSVKGGTVSMNASATPFYTLTTNPYNLTLNINESQTITWIVNATGSPNTPYEFFVYSNKTSNQTIGSQTSKLNITILDIIAPLSNITYPLNTTYNSEVNSINYTSYDYTGGGSCWYSNSSGVWNSTAVTVGINFTNVVSIDNSNTFTLYCNDSSGNLNSTSVTFQKKIPKIALDIIYPTTNIDVNKSNLFNVTINVSCSIANCGAINVTLDPSGTVYNFTTCNNNGISGPSQTQCNSSYSGTTLVNSVNVTSGIQTWVVPVTGSYTIEVAGAQGGRGGSSYAGNNPGGLGARMKGTFQLTQGTVLQILVGQNGTNDYTYAAYGGGGGGGTFVANGTNYSVATPLIVAGGGGGGGSVGTNDSNAPTTTYALNGSNYNNGYGGTNGGAAWGGSYGGGAGGFYNSSTGGQGSSRGYGFRQGGSGTTGAAGGSGGFGGGGGGYGGGGGGGGYSGGGGGGWSYAGWGGGGGSYNLGTSQVNTAGINSGPGFVTITLLDSAKGGTISMNTNATPFYTLTTNPYNLVLNNAESQTVTWWVNATGDYATYQFFAYANTTSLITPGNSSNYWNVTITNGTLTDNVFVVFSNYSDNNASIFSGGLATFSVNLANTNGTLWLRINGTNYPATNLSSNFYNVSIIGLTNGTYSYTWNSYANGINNNLNAAATRYYTVNLRDVFGPSLSIISPLNTTYTTTPSNLSIRSNKNISWCGYSLDNSPNLTLNVNSSSTGAIYSNPTIAEGSHTVIFSCNDTSNNFNSTSRMFFLDTIPPYISISSPANTSYNTKTLTINLATNSDARNLWFNRGLGNETYSSQISKTFSEGTNTIYAYANDSLGNLNSTSITFFIDSLAPSITINYPEEKTYTISTIDFNITTNEDSSCWLVLNSSDNYTLQTLDNRNFNYTLILNSSTYPISYYCNDSLNNIAVKNVLFGVDVVPPQITLNSPASNRYYNLGIIEFNYTPLASDGLDTCELWGNWNGGWHLNQSTTSLTNDSSNYFTQSLEDGSYIWNIWCNNTLGMNDWSTQGNITFTIDKTPPFVGFIYPISTSYNTSIISLEITNNSDASSIWWFNGSTNISYLNSLDINIQDGLYNYIAYANDSAGNLNSTSISFYVDTNTSQFSSHQDNNATLIGSGIALFNVTLSNTNGTVWLSINNQIVTATNLTQDIYNASYNISSPGIYQYLWFSYSSGISHLLGSSESMYYYVNETDSTPPEAVLLLPENNSYLNFSEVNLTVNLSDITLPLGDTESGIKNATLNIYNSTNNLVNQTTLSENTPGTLTSVVGLVVSLVDGVYKWFYSIFDFAGNSFTTANNTFTIDTTAPTISIVYPSNNAQLTVNLVQINYTASDTNLDSCWYDEVGISSNNNLDNCNNLTSVLTEGEHNFTLWTNDSAGNIKNATIRIEIDTAAPSVSLDNPNSDVLNYSEHTTEVTFNCSATDTRGLKNISLYLTDPNNQNLALNQTAEVTGLSNQSGWTLTLLHGNYTVDCKAYDLFGNSNFASSSRRYILNYVDIDGDSVPDTRDTILYNESAVSETGFSQLNITVGGNSSQGTFEGEAEVAFQDNVQKVVNFTYNFSAGTFDLSKVEINKDSNSVLINLSGQLQLNYLKTIYLLDNSFVKFCAVDKDISSLSEISADCTGTGETNFDDCLGNDTSISRNGLLCTELNGLITVSNLQYSALRGTPRVTSPSTPTTETSTGGGGGGAAIIKSKTSLGCITSKDCATNNYCFENTCHVGECKTNSDCTDGKSCFDLRCVKLFDVKILEVSPQIDAGNLIHFTYFLKAMANINNDVIVNFWLEKDGKTISSGKDTIFIGNMEEKTEQTKIFIPTNTPPGVYNFHVSVTYDKYSAESYRQIQIDERGNLLLSKNTTLYYLVPLLALIAILLSLIVIKLYKKKIKDLYRYEQEYALTHKLLISIICILIIFLIVISILNILGIIHIASFNDYLLSLKEIINRDVIPNIWTILTSVIIVALIFFIIRHKRKINNSLYGGEKLVIEKANYLEHGLKKIHNNLDRWRIQRNLRNRVNILEKKGYDVDLVKKGNMKDKINEWKKKGYDTEVLAKEKKSMHRQINEWRKKGYDVGAIGG